MKAKCRNPSTMGNQADLENSSGKSWACSNTSCLLAKFLLGVERENQRTTTLLGVPKKKTHTHTHTSNPNKTRFDSVRHGSRASIRGLKRARRCPCPLLALCTARSPRKSKAKRPSFVRRFTHGDVVLQLQCFSNTVHRPILSGGRSC